MDPTSVSRTEELRLAMVMNGGVSLAVWMGGVSFEMNRFVGETHPVYRRLLELTQTNARIDVISGTSAGGINGAALALASIYDTSLSSLRNVWLENAAFADLLRSSDDTDPKSVLDGDGYFLPMLKEAFAGLKRETPRNTTEAPMDLTLTTTLLRGEVSSRLDGLGELIEDASHRGQFHFTRHPQVSEDSFADPDITDKLAGAARSTASFPVAFEPVLAQPDQLRVNGRKPQSAHYVMDGGVLDNKPIESAIRAVYSMPAHGNVRRVLAYVIPDPGASTVKKDDSAAEPPTLAEVTFASLVGIPAIESIADQLEQIDLHNQAVRRNRSLPVSLTQSVQHDLLPPIAASVFGTYRAHRISGLLDYVLDEIERCAEDRQRAARPGSTNTGAAKPTGASARDPLLFGSTTRQWLKATWLRANPELQNEMWRQLIPTAESGWSFASPEGGSFTWGLFAIEYLHSILMDLLRRTQRLQHVQTQGTSREVPVSLDSDPHQAGSTADWESQDRLIRDFRSARAETAKEDTEATGRAFAKSAFATDSRLATLWTRAFDLAAQLRRGRQAGTLRFQENANVLLDNLATAAADSATDDEQEQIALKWLVEQFSLNTRTEQYRTRVAEQNVWIWQLVDIVAELLEFVVPLAVADNPNALRPEENNDRAALTLFALYLYRENFEDLAVFGNHPWSLRSALLARLLTFEILQYAFASRPNSADSLVELVQISARQSSPLGGPATPAQRLAGMQLAHFGAFYRKGWRANDWMIGRLDGISRIVRIALNPERLHRLYAWRPVHVGPEMMSPSEYVYRVLHKICVADADTDHRSLLQQYWLTAESRIRTELAYLDSPRARVRDALTAATEMLTRRLHLEVICTEIPNLAKAIADDLDSGAASPKGRRLLGQLGVSMALQTLAGSLPPILNRLVSASLPRPAPPAAISLRPAEAIELFNSYRVGSESLSDEVGTDLMLRTGSQSLYVAFAAATGKHSGLGPVAKLLGLLRWPVIAFYLLANRIAQDSRLNAAVTTSVLLAGALLVTASMSWKDAPGMLAIAGWSLLFAWFATAYLRRVWVFGFGLLAVAAMCLVLVTWLPDEMRTHAYAQVIGPVVILVLLFTTLLLPRPLVAFGTAIAACWWFSGMPNATDIRGAACLTWGLSDCLKPWNETAGTHFVQALMALALIAALVLLSKLVRPVKSR